MVCRTTSYSASNAAMCLHTCDHTESCQSRGPSQQDTEAFGALVVGTQAIVEAQAAIMLAREMRGKIRPFSEASSRLRCLPSVMKARRKLERADEAPTDRLNAREPRAVAKRDLGNESTLLTSHWWTPHYSNRGSQLSYGSQTPEIDTLDCFREAAHAIICKSRTQISSAVSIVGKAWQTKLWGRCRLAEGSGLDARVSC